ncbi:TonB-dependent receptor [Amantichitinum ursilacus]|uniref:Ferrichrome receptor FcuA n=1 Tax=Amantichitinum ursilacus TaxID=857265 RepID=A0A0N1JS12_9NEIS|nr:TonB-dependent receptor [Amantichitinum ursilacus]KPC51892.1 Ferrichrome receptor FcuA precursor [Amantichitinum ursilacus]
MNKRTPIAMAVAIACQLPIANAADNAVPDQLETVVVTASADASKDGLQPAYAGGQVAKGGRAGILGSKNNMDTPFAITAYTNELIKEQQAHGVGDVLENAPGVRVARGFGNFQESYFIRGFILSSDDIAYNGLYSLLPRQYIATELFERVEVLQGATGFLTGAAPNGGGIGGSINLLPKRAPNTDLNEITVGVASGGSGTVSADVARRFGPDKSIGLRVNAGYTDGGTAIDDEKAATAVMSVGLDWRGENARISADIGQQSNRLKETRPSVTLGAGVTALPSAPDASKNFAQPWSYSNERDTFGTLRGEYDFSKDITGWAAYGMRRSHEANSLANMTVNDNDGNGSVYRFDNTRDDRVDTAELGLRGKLKTGSIGHEWVLAGSFFELKKDNAYAMDFFNTLNTNIYHPTSYAEPAISSTAFLGNTLDTPLTTGIIRLTSAAAGDTLSMLDDQVLVTAGARYQHFDITNYAYNTQAADPAYIKSRVSPAVAIVYKPIKQVSVYANYIEGLAQGDTAPSTATNRGEMLSPFVSKQKEVGVKYDGGRLGAGLALFSTTKPRSILNSDSYFSSSGEDRHEGAELTVYGVAMPGLRVLGGVTWLNARQKNTGSTTTEDKHVIGVPTSQANMGVDWDIKQIEGLSANARVIYTGSAYANDLNTIEVPSWTRLDLGMAYATEWSGRPVTLRARLDNVFNRDYWASVGGYPGYGYLTVGAPRTVSVSATVDF